MSTNTIRTIIGKRIDRICSCTVPTVGLYGSVPPRIVCWNCKEVLGNLLESDWNSINRTLQARRIYTEFFERSKLTKGDFFLMENLEHKSIVVDLTNRGTTQQSNSPTPIVLPSFPGHIEIKNEAAIPSADSCAHRWVIFEGIRARCLLCESVRDLSPDEQTVIANATKLGVSFLNWDRRFEALDKIRSSTSVGTSKKAARAARRASKKAAAGPATGTAPRKAVTEATEIPDGFIPVGEAATRLGLDPKKLRKQIREGKREGLKIGGAIFTKIS